MQPSSHEVIKIKVKNEEFLLKSMNDYFERMYLDDRDERVGL